MKKNILLFALAAGVFASCGTLKTSQTSDDVYYSAERTVEVDRTEDKKEKRTYNYEDRAVRMRTEDGRRWSSLENPNYYSTYRYDYNCNCNCNQYGSYYGNKSNVIWSNNGYYYGNNGYGFNNYYAPNYVAILPQTSPKYIAPKGGGIYGSNGNNGYNNTSYNNNNSSNENKGGSGLINRVFNSGNSSGGSDNSPRTYTPSSSSSSSSSGSSSGSSGASRPARSGN